MKDARKREARRLILQRSRERRRNGRRIALVEYDGATVDMLVRRGLLTDGAIDARAIDARAIANAMTRLHKSLE
jgi:hypothetical protein